MRAPSAPSRLVPSLLLGAALAAAGPALAQSPAPTLATSPTTPPATSPTGDAAVPVATPIDSAPATVVAPRGPTMDGARAAAVLPRRAEEQRDAAALAPSNKHMGQSVALMIVGGAAVVVGLIVGDTGGDLLAFGGAVVGLVGLYQYLR